MMKILLHSVHSKDAEEEGDHAMHEREMEKGIVKL